MDMTPARFAYCNGFCDGAEHGRRDTPPVVREAVLEVIRRLREADEKTTGYTSGHRAIHEEMRSIEREVQISSVPTDPAEYARYRLQRYQEMIEQSTKEDLDRAGIILGPSSDES